MERPTRCNCVDANMSKPIAYQGLVREGPLKGKTLTHPHQRYEGKFQDADGQPVADGFYVWRRASGPEPASWKWVQKK